MDKDKLGIAEHIFAVIGCVITIAFIFILILFVMGCVIDISIVVK